MTLCKECIELYTFRRTPAAEDALDIVTFKRFINFIYLFLFVSIDPMIIHLN